MKCKICGGEILFSKGNGTCQSCGADFVADSVYENTEVYICYKENDDAGRRTKDSIIAQEVYNKLESSNINTFYERISADGKIEDDLEESKYSAISKAKVVLVVGTNKEIFTELEKKYGEVFYGKKVIPFCIDVNPGDISKTLSSIQAVNYSSIGWDKDLISGLYNLLGKEEPDSKKLYGNKHKKTIVIITIVSVLVLLALGIGAFWFLGGTGSKIEETQPVTETQARTQQDIYNEAEEYFDQDKYIESLILLNQIPDHPNSSNLINQIYSKYEGYYQNGDVVIHLEISDNINAEVDVKITSKGKVVSTAVNTEIVVDKVEGDYRDSHKNTGKLELILENDGLILTLNDDSKEDDTKVSFKLSEKSDQPIIQINKDMLFEWLNNAYTTTQITDLGYELEPVENLATAEFAGLGNVNMLYKVNGIEVYLSMITWYFPPTPGSSAVTLDDAVVVGVSAPAELIAPSLIGEGCYLRTDGNVAYCPNAYLRHMCVAEFKENYFENSGSTVTNDTIVGVALIDSEYMTAAQFQYCLY